MDYNEQLGVDLVQVARLAGDGKGEDLRLYLARLIRRYRRQSPSIAKELESVLAELGVRPARGRAEHRFESADSDPHGVALIRPGESGNGEVDAPVLSPSVRAQFEALIAEWAAGDQLRAQGLAPASSVIMTGAPGVGKTYSARWLANRLGMPMYSLDLTAVMSSRLGQSGANLRSVLDFARKEPAVLFLDEVDSIAKRRSDESDVGELKRLVTIMLQELDDWPSTSLLIAATNHPELVDRALWRRFEVQVDFPSPGLDETSAAIKRFLDRDLDQVSQYIPVLERVLRGASISEVERRVKTLRKGLIVGGNVTDAVGGLLQDTVSPLPRADRIALADELRVSTEMSQHQIARLTTVSRDTIRKHARSAEGE